MVIRELTANLMAVSCPWGHGKGHLGRHQKKVDAKKGVTKLFILHTRGTIDNDFTTLWDIELAKPSKGMEIILSTVQVDQPRTLSDIIQETCITANKHDCLNLRSKLVPITYVSKSFSNHLLASNLSIKRATSLNNKENSIDSTSFLPQKYACMIKKDRSRDLTARTKNNMDVINGVGK